MTSADHTEQYTADHAHTRLLVFYPDWSTPTQCSTINLRQNTIAFQSCSHTTHVCVLSYNRTTLTLTRWPGPNDLDLDIVKMYLHTKNEVSTSKLSKTHVFTAPLTLLTYLASASYPQWDRKWVVAYLAWAMGEGLVWLIRTVVCLLAALRVQLSVSVGNGWPHNVLQYH